MNLDIDHSGGTGVLFALANSVTLNVDDDGNVVAILAIDDDREVAVGGGSFTATGVRDGVIASFDDVNDLDSAVKFLRSPRTSI